MRRATRWLSYILLIGVAFILFRSLYSERMDNIITQAQCDAISKPKPAGAGLTPPKGCTGGTGDITQAQCDAIKAKNLPDALPTGCEKK